MIKLKLLHIYSVKNILAALVSISICPVRIQTAMCFLSVLALVLSAVVSVTSGVYKRKPPTLQSWKQPTTFPLPEETGWDETEASFTRGFKFQQDGWMVISCYCKKTMKSVVMKECSLVTETVFSTAVKSTQVCFGTCLEPGSTSPACLYWRSTLQLAAHSLYQTKGSINCRALSEQHTHPLLLILKWKVICKGSFSFLQLNILSGLSRTNQVIPVIPAITSLFCGKTLQFPVM